MPPAPDPDSRPNDLHLAFTATPVAIRDSLQRMLTLPPLCGLSEDGRGMAELVLAEVLNNVAEHAYANRPGPVTVSIGQTPQGLRCVIVDQGRAMPGHALPEGRLPGSLGPALEDLPEGGFGWHLIRSLTQGLSYTRVDGCNRLQFLLP
ncbi:ATP-binding protein [Tabrizicola sp.]|uniref:ATP-binding protein n=1 Tax=Tabrizicola sp. TaxID=2005166 RepID=UPI002FDDA399